METCCRFLSRNYLRSIELRQNKRVDKFAGKSIFRVYSKSLQQSKYRYLDNLLAFIEEIGYFTFSDNNVVIPQRGSKFHFCLR